MTTEPGQQFFRRSRSVVSRVIGGEILIVPVRGKVGNLASIYSFSGTGSLIWQLLESPRALTDLAGAVQREYGVRPEQAQSDVTQFVAEMFSAGLVEVCQGVAMIAAESNVQVEWETAGSR